VRRAGAIWCSGKAAASAAEGGSGSSGGSGVMDPIEGESSSAGSSRFDAAGSIRRSTDCRSDSSSRITGDRGDVSAELVVPPCLPPRLLLHPPPPLPEHADLPSQPPQSGVWVGAAASVELTGCVIARCLGPGVKIYRGRLKAQGNTIAFSTRGANVVANGGNVVLRDNEIKGANGDGIALWKETVTRIERNWIHANSGAGIAINHGSGSVSISNNAVFDNKTKNVDFTTSQKHATMHGNDFEGSSARAMGCADAAGASAAALHSEASQAQQPYLEKAI